MTGVIQEDPVVEKEITLSLEACLQRIRHLEEENAHLRAAAQTFGELAERLERVLTAERRRRTHGERSHVVTPHAASDR